jgi:hypothetical protein
MSGYVFGEVDARIKPDRSVIFDDPNFNDGVRGWHQLWNANEPSGPITLASHSAATGARSLYLCIEDGVGSTAVQNNWIDASAIKRMTQVGGTKIAWECLVGWRSLYAQNGFRAMEFGLDYADLNGNRHFPKFRYAHYSNSARDGSGSWSRTNKLQILDADGFPTDFPSAATYNWPYNENKSNLVYVCSVFDIVNNVYDGFQIGAQTYGSLAGLKDAQNPLRTLGSPPPTTLTTFDNGMNFTLEARGRVDTTLNESRVVMARARGWVYA